MKKLNNFHIQRASLQYELHNVLLSWKQHQKSVLNGNEAKKDPQKIVNHIESYINRLIKGWEQNSNTKENLLELQVTIKAKVGV